MAEYLIQDTTLTAIADAIRAKTGKGDAIAVPNMAAEIAGITAAGGGGSSADVRYVTFMSYDGTVEYGRRAVAIGDDCADPIARGLFDTPTRESTVQHDYTFCGWAATVNGAVDSNWNKAVTEDKTVYAIFDQSLRRYTITYYDGESILKTESLAYGTIPSYIPEKSGYSFVGWEPALAAVTGDASYYAQFSEKLSFAGASWADIAAISAAGEAANNFAIGDTKEVSITYADGTTGTITVAIAGFGIDDKADGSGKAGITIVTKTVPNYKTAWSNSTDQSSCIYKNSLVRAALQKNGAIWNMLPTALTSVIKNVNKQYDASVYNGQSPSLLTLTDPLWALSTYEFGQATNAKTTAMSPGGSYVSMLGSRYPLYPVIDMTGYFGVKTDFPYVSTGTVKGQTWTRSLYRLGVSAVCIIASLNDGTAYNGYKDGNDIKGERYVCFGFCI